MKKKVAETEDASTLQFGAEFQNEDCLTISDVLFLLQVQRETRGDVVMPT